MSADTELDWREISEAHRGLSTLTQAMREQLAARDEAHRKLAKANENIDYLTQEIADARAALLALESGEQAQ